MAKQTMKLVYFVDTTDNHKDEVCVFNPKDYPKKEDLATAINKNIPEMTVIFRPNRKSVISSITLNTSKYYFF